jgi:hypothetical protein
MSEALFQSIGESVPDSLIVSAKIGIITKGAKLAPKQGILKRGSLIGEAADSLFYLAGTEVATVSTGATGVLTDDVDTGDATATTAIITTQYITGDFNKKALSVKAPATVDGFEATLRTLGIYMEDVQ